MEVIKTKRGLSVAFVYIGLVIGAGFASGREIIEYFNYPSNTDYSGIVLSTFLLISICYIILRKTQLWGITDCNEYLDCVCGKFSGMVKIFMLLFMFCGFFTMLSGSGALIAQSFTLPHIIGVLLMLLICFITLSFNIKGIISINAILVPCMILGIFYICISSVLFDTTQVFSARGVTRSVLFSGVCYVSYNTVSAPSVLIPLQKNLRLKEIRIASVVGGFILGLLILVIWTCQGVNFDLLWQSEIPMLQLAAMAGRMQKYIYTCVLFMAICTTAVSQGFGILEYFRITEFKQRIKASAILCLMSLPFALVGFSSLVSHMYLFFGICGIGWMIWLFIDFFKKSTP